MTKDITNDAPLNEKKNNRRTAKRKKFDSITYTTGDIGLNIDRFNQAMGTFNSTADVGAGEGECGDSSCAESLNESKRYVRRYYIRPQNIFCSNKADIIKALIELGNTNCSIYTLNNLGDDKDVSKLMNSDIIYYYDEGILYDKNKVKVMDYDLSIKKEENRKHFANVDKAPEKEFKNEYSDRMTSATELEESANVSALGFTIKELEKALTQTDYPINFGESLNDEEACTYNWEITKPEGPKDQFCVTGWGYNIYTDEDGIENSEYFDTLEDAYNYMLTIAASDSFKSIPIYNVTKDAFNLDFEDFNAYGERLTEAKQSSCCICGEPIEGYGNNPEPFMSETNGQCCDGCNLKFVIPARINSLKGE